MAPKISASNPQLIILKSLRKINHTEIQRGLKRILGFLSLKPAEVSFLFCDNALIRRLNKRFFRKSSATDVISFPLRDDYSPGYLGEVVVSVEEAIKKSSRYGNSWQDELLLYCTHGVLHLLGYDDLTKNKRLIMEKKQEEIMSKLFNNFKKQAISHQPSAISSRKKRKKLKADS
ncbi:MAG: rRNA maturation RNase YbeY [Candidatus Omnitrophica bacterium]|nr:rRNA maturation RNase YbeY [Candidatus Omnitrophota bacterium]